MNVDSYETPQTRSEFELRFYCLHNIIMQGRFQEGSHANMDGIRKVRKLPNGRIDFLSVNEEARLHANMLYKMKNVIVANRVNDIDSQE